MNAKIAVWTVNMAVLQYCEIKKLEQLLIQYVKKCKLGSHSHCANLKIEALL